MPEMDADLKGRIALVTGGSQGIGAATAVALGRAGASVALTYNNSEAAALQVVDAVRKTGVRAIALKLDLRDGISVRSVVGQVVEEFGRIDILVNNAAVGSASVLHYSSPAEIDRSMIEINTLGALLCVEAVLPVMVANDFGKIINVSSVGGGIAAFPGFLSSDGMSKSAVAFLSKQIVADHPYQRIDAFSICPGAVDTRMFRESTLDPMTPEQREDFISTLPQQRLIKPEEVASLVLFLCTPAATICRGAVIDASLGLGIRPDLVSGKTQKYGRS